MYYLEKNDYICKVIGIQDRNSTVFVPDNVRAVFCQSPINNNQSKFKHHRIMIKKMNRMLSAFMVLSALMAVHADAVGQRCIYFGGPDNWMPPTVENSELFENSKLLETSPGSDVYVGRMTTHSENSYLYFCLYAELSDISGDPCFDPWQNKRIGPKAGALSEENAEYLEPKGKSGVYEGTLAYYDIVPPNIDSPTWRISHAFDDAYTVVADLGKGKITIMPEHPVYVVVGEADAPTFDNVGEYRPVDSFVQYVPEGDFSFRLYDVLESRWLNPVGDGSYDAGASVALDYVVSAEKGKPFVLKNPQGIVSMNYLADVNFVIARTAPDRVVPEVFSATDLCIMGDYTVPVWDFNATDLVSYSFQEPVSRFNIELPVGVSNWKIVAGYDWERPNFGPEAVVREADGSFTAYLKRDGSNFVMTEVLDRPVSAVVDFETMTVTFPAGTPIETFGTRTLNDGSYPDDIDEMLVLERHADIIPWTGASAAVMERVGHLYRQPDGSYKGTVTLDDSFVIQTSRTAQGLAPGVYAPSLSADRTLVLNEGRGYSSAVAALSDNCGYWKVPDYFVGCVAEITVIPQDGAQAARLEIMLPDRVVPDADCIWLVGSPQGWNIEESSVVLLPTTVGGYYGSVEIPDDGTDPVFRFYTELGNWERNSIGCMVDDMIGADIDFFENDVFSGRCLSGKGSWSITGWTGGTLYMYVNPAESTVRFSPNPMDYTIDENAGPKQRVFAYNSSRVLLRELQAAPDGTFNSFLYIPEEGVETFYLFSEYQSVSPDDSLWGTVGALNPATDELMGADMFGVAEAALVADAAQARPFSIDAASFGFDGNAALVVDLEAGKVYAELNPAGYYLTGYIAGGRQLTFENRAEWADLYVGAGKAVNIPAGKFDFVFRAGIAQQQNDMPDQTVDFGNDGVYVSSEPMFGFIGSHVSCADWAGGYVMITPGVLCDLSRIGDITAVVDGGRFESKLSRRSGDALVYSGKAAFARGDNSPMLFFAINRQEGQGALYERECMIASPAYASVNGIVNLNESVLVTSGGECEAALRAGGIPFSLPYVFDSGEMDIEINLADMTMTLAVDASNERPAYEAVAGGDSALDGVLATPVDAAGTAVSAVANIGESTEFNFTKTDGAVIAPAPGEEAIVFGSDGLWSGHISVSGEPAASRRAARRAAAEASKWKLSIPEGMNSDIHILIDESAATITAFSSAHNTDTYFIVTERLPEISNLDLFSGKTLTRNASGIFTGEFSVEPGETPYVSFYASLAGNGAMVYGLSLPIGTAASTRSFDFSSAEELTVPAFGREYMSVPMAWQVSGVDGVVSVAFDPLACELTMNASQSGIDDVAVDGASLVIVPGAGFLRVSASASTRLDVYSVTGMRVRSVGLEPGTTEIELPAGFYIAGGRKFFVR